MVRKPSISLTRNCGLNTLKRLQSVGIEVVEAEKAGQFELLNWEDAYLRDGHFDQNKMLALIEEVLDGWPSTGV